jgi:hypothetical protein
MVNLKKALSKIFTTAMVVDRALEDKKIRGIEWAQIGASAIGFVWIFRNFDLIAEDMKALKEEDLPELNAWVVENFDIRNDVVEAIVEEALAMLALFASVMINTREPVA